MILSGTLVSSGLGGKYVPVDELRIGDTLKDPLTQKVGRILDIRYRDLDFEIAGVQLFSPYRPVQIGAGALGRQRPSRNLLVSPEQEVLVMVPRKDGTAPILELRSASSLGTLPDIGIESTLRACRYFLILMEADQLIEVEGAILNCLSFASSSKSKFSANSDRQRQLHAELFRSLSQ